MVVFAWVVAGALLGGAAGALDGTTGRAAFALNVAAGVAGVLLGGWLLGVLTGGSPFVGGTLGLGSLVVSLMGASVLLIVPHVVRVAGGAGDSLASEIRGLETAYTVREPK